MVAVWPDAMPQSAPFNGLDLQHRSAAEKRSFCATELGSRPQPDGGTEVQRGVAGIQHAGQFHCNVWTRGEINRNIILFIVHSLSLVNCSCSIYIVA